MAASGGGSSNTGIELDVAFPVSTATVSLERDTSSGFGTAVTIATLTGGSQTYVDNLPLDGVTYYYRAKATSSGFTDSSYSSTVSAKPIALLV